MDQNEIKDLIDQNTDQIHELIKVKIQIWAEHVVFSKLWWLSLVLSVVPWILWSLFRRKRSTDRLLYSGFFVMVMAMTLDVLGDQFGFWHYRFNLIPVLPTYFPWDLTLMPVSVMAFIQFKPRMSPFIKAFLFALIASYIGESIFEWLGIYVREKWYRTCSVPFQFSIYLVAHYLSRRNKYDELS